MKGLILFIPLLKIHSVFHLYLVVYSSDMAFNIHGTITNIAYCLSVWSVGFMTFCMSAALGLQLCFVLLLRFLTLLF